MNRTSVRRLGATLAELKARHRATVAVPTVAADLEAAGFRVHCRWDDGLSVDEAPGLSEKLDELRARGFAPGLVVILRSFDEPSDGTRGAVGTVRDRDRLVDASTSPIPATLSANTRVSDPTTYRSRDGY